MDDSNYNEVFVFDMMDRLKCPSMIKIIGVGKFGGDVVESINRAELHDIDFITINHGGNAQPFDRVPEQDKVRSIAQYDLDNNDPTIEEKLQDIMGNLTTLVFVISSLDEDYSTIVSALCHRVHIEENDEGNQVSLALLRTPKEGGTNDYMHEYIDRIAKEATKVMTFDRVGDSTKSLCSSLHDEKQRVIDVIRTICKIFIDYDYCCVDYNDVATVLQSGTNAVYGTGKGVGDKREEKAVSGLIQHIKSNGCKIEEVKYMLLLLDFAPLYQLTYKKLNIMTDLLYRSIGKYVDVLWNATSNNSCDSDALVVSAIAVQ